VTGSAGGVRGLATVHRRHLRWSADGTWDRVLAAVQVAADAGGLDWRVSVDSTIVRVHQHAATAGRSSSGPSSRTGASPNDKDRPRRRDEPDDHGIGRSRGGLTTKTHALVHSRGRLLVAIVSPGQAAD
jgi:hypothetical protein